MARLGSARRASGLLALLSLSFSLAFSRSAAAQDAGEAWDGIVYEAPPACPSKGELLAEIAAHPSPAPAVDTRTFRVAIERAADGAFEGRLEVIGASDIPRVPRRTRAADCVAVMRTLALFVVIARTPDPLAAPLPKAPTTDPPAPTPSPPRQQRKRGREHAKPPPPATPHLRYGAAVRPALLVPSSTSASATLATGARIQTELAWLPVQSRIAPLVRLSFGTASFDTEVNAGEASFRLRTGRLEGCADIDLGHALALVPCVGGEIGDLVATTSSLPFAVRASTQWKAFTVGGGLRWSVLPWLFVGADLVAVVPFTRKKFGFVDPVQVVYSVPAAFLDLGAVAGVSARFD